MGAWACQACADRLGLDVAGTAAAERGYCGAGGHEAREEIRWLDQAERAVLVPVHPQIVADLVAAEPRGAGEARLRHDSAGAAALPRAVTPEGQFDMFGPNREPLRGAG